VTDGKFHRAAANQDELDTIAMLGIAISKLLRDDGANPDVCRHVLLKLVITHYKWNIENQASKEEVAFIMWDEYANIVRSIFQEDSPEILGIMLQTAKEDAAMFDSTQDNAITT
jgi:hypothetical protein